MITRCSCFVALMAVICLQSSICVSGFPKRLQHEILSSMKSYVVHGVLMLPYAEIKEPFTAYYDKVNNRSRIDYYGGMVKTYQRADLGLYGISYKIAFMPDNKGQPIQTCFQVNGTSNNTVAIQSIIPDFSSFSYLKDDKCISLSRDMLERICEVYVLENTDGNKVNRYTLYLQKTSQLPVYYQMKGYNSLLGSHYDKYEVYYTSFITEPVSDKDFKVEKGMKCRSFPGPGVQQMVSNNPMVEFINREDRHIHEAFNDFVSKHKKDYGDEKEHFLRKNIFRQNYRFVSSVNRAGLSYALKVNHLSDFTDSELLRLRGRLPSKGYNGGKQFPGDEISGTLPDFVDWQLFGAVTPVKDQAVCGSCWSFGTTGAVEGAHFMKTQNLVRLSEQQLIDCSWQFQNNGCDGGEDFRAYKYIMNAGGLATDDVYGSYLGQDGICHDRNVTKAVTITGFVNVTEGSTTALKQALAYKGPVSVSIDASLKTFSFYSHGIYYDPQCKNGNDQLDHSVLAVGYGSANGSDYWIVKNSWSTYWGNDGYVLMSQKDNNCGVATSATYVVI